jgi:hypothetical protein
MSTNWTDSALCRFFSDYVVEANEVKVSPGYLNHLQKLYGEGTDDIITHAVSVVSLASFSNQVGSEDLLSSIVGQEGSVQSKANNQRWHSCRCLFP